MMYHPTLDKLQQLKLSGMVRALQEQEAVSGIGTMPFEERLGLMIDRELPFPIHRNQRGDGMINTGVHIGCREVACTRNAPTLD